MVLTFSRPGGEARRSELSIRPPIGFVYNPDAVLTLDPDQQVQHPLPLLFETYRRTGSASATVKARHDQGLLFTRRLGATGRRTTLIISNRSKFPIGTVGLPLAEVLLRVGAAVLGRAHSVRQRSEDNF